MKNITAYIGFNGQCREAMNFYKDCMGGELTIQTVAETPMADQCSASEQNNVMHSMLVSGQAVIMGTDMVSPAGYTLGNNIALAINCSSEEEIESLYTKLSEGGKVMEPLKDMFWGAKFAAIMDKYNINWMLNYDKNQIG